MSYDVVIVTYNSADVIAETLDSVVGSTVKPAHIFVIDSASTDATVEVITKRHPRVTLLPQKKNVGFGKGNMLGFAQAKSDFILLVNPDVRLEPTCAEHLLETAKHQEKLAAVSPVIYEGWGDKEQLYGFGAAVTSYGFGVNLTPDMSYQPNSFTGACALLRTEVTKRYGFEKRFFLYYEEPELAVRLLKDGWEFGREGKAVCHHLSGHSGPKEAAKALGFRQFYSIQNRWFSIGKHWPWGKIVPTIGFNILHLGYFILFYLKNGQWNRLSLLLLAPAKLLQGLLLRGGRVTNRNWSRELTPMSFREMFGMGQQVVAAGKETD